MRLHLTSAYAEHPSLDTLMEQALLDNELNHSVCESAEHADAIVFVESTQFDDVMFKKLRSHRLVKQYPHKVFMFNEMDRPWPVLPGLYTCMPEKHVNPNQQAAFAYLSTPNPFIRNVYHENLPRRWLYSFMGAMSHGCRRTIMKLSDEQAHLQDTSGFNVWNASPSSMQERARNYAQVLGSSQFVLCPRGIGTSTIRLYETLEAGRVPVIISDQWIPPGESDWAFAVRVRQNKIRTLPQLLRACEDEASERGEAARETWLEHYAPGTLFNTLGNAIERLLIIRATQETGNSGLQHMFPVNKWMASSGLYARTAIQRMRGQR